MLNESAYERIRRAYHIEKKSINQIAQEEEYNRQTITKIINQASPKPYQLTNPRLGQSLTSINTVSRSCRAMGKKKRKRGHD